MGRPIFIAGPTASGKSAVAMELARHLGGAIVSVDSMQVYRGMDLGTAKPSAEEQAAIRHHLIDITELTESYDAATFISQAEDAVAAEEQAIFCGGTGLYFQALLEGLGEAPRAKAKIRAELENTATEKLIEELAEKDPTTHGAIDHQNRRRLRRPAAMAPLRPRWPRQSWWLNCRRSCRRSRRPPPSPRRARRQLRRRRRYALSARAPLYPKLATPRRIGWR